MPASAQVAQQRLARAGREADAEAVGRLPVEAPLVEELPAGDRVGRLGELGGVELRGDPVRLDQPLALAALALPGRPAALGVAQLDPEPDGQPLDRLDEDRPSISCRNEMTSPPSAQPKQCQ